MYDAVFAALKEEMLDVGVDWPADYRMICDWEQAEVSIKLG